MDWETIEAEYSESIKGFDTYFDMTADDLEVSEDLLLYPIQSELSGMTERYTQPELIGEGGRKYIYKVHDNNTGRDVAMGMLRNPSDKEHREQFLREARLTALLQHPNIIPIYDTSLDGDGNPFFTMELLEGKSLSTILNDTYPMIDSNAKYSYSSVNIGSFIENFIKICDAISYAHSQDILHLDLKPDNIHVGDFGEVYVCDWGLGRILTEDEDELCDEAIPSELLHLTMAGNIKGTPGFMAPEQCVEHGEKTRKTDIYSLGAILYTLLTGRMSVNGNSIETVLENTRCGRVVPFADCNLDHDLSPRLEAVVMKALATEPDNRYHSVAELRRDIVNYTQGFATDAEDAGIVTLITLLVKRHKMVSVLVFLFLTAMLFFMVELKRKENRAVTAREEAEHALELFRIESRENQNLHLNIAQMLTDLGNQGSYYDSEKELASIDSTIDSINDKKMIKALWNKKGIIYFTDQKFNLAYEAFTTGGKTDGTLVELASLYKDKKSDEEQFSDKRLAKIISLLKKEYHFVALALYEKHMIRRSLDNTTLRHQDYLPLAEVVLKLVNPQQVARFTKGIISRSNNGFALDLSSSNIRVLHPFEGSQHNILSALNLNSLDLSYSKFIDLDQLKGLKGVKRLNLTGCELKTLNLTHVQLLKEIGVEELIISENSCSHKELSRLKREFTVIDSKE